MKYFDKNTWFLVLLAALFFLPFLGGVHLFDWDEINFAELAREMLVTGDWLRLQINFERFTEKPPLFFWLQAISMSVFGVGEYAARLPNAVLGVFVLPFLYVSGKFLIDRKFGFLWALSWFGSILPFLYFKSGIIDPFFNFFIFNGLFFIIHYIWKNKEEPDVYFSKSKNAYLWIAGISIGLAILTKGPVAYLIIALTVGSYWLVNRFKSFISIVTLVWISLIAVGVFSLWLLADTVLNGTDFLEEFTIRQWELLTRNDAGHGGFPGYHFVVLFFGCFPASIFALRSLASLGDLKSHIKDFQKWMIILLTVILVLFSVVSTKIVHYSSMAYYPITFLCALALWRSMEDKSTFKVWTNVLLVVVGLIAIFISIILPLAGMHIEELKPIFEKDAFAQANLRAEVNWTVIDFFPALLLVAAIIAYLSLVKSRKLLAYKSLFYGVAIWCMVTLGLFIQKIEQISQNAAVEFFESYAQKDVYVSTFGYKSYVPWFYSKIQNHNNPKAIEREWLLHGEIDKDVLISTKITKVDKLEEQIPDAEFLYEKNGFYFYKRSAQLK